ncbi:MAG: efflux RND transporter periplasmic adaptor subunit [Planctomycetota bacterium]
MQASLIALSAALAVTGPQQGLEPSASTQTCTCFVNWMDEVIISANEPGEIKDLYVREGHEVTEGQQIGQIDDEMEQQQKLITQYTLEAAEEKSKNTVSVDYGQAVWDLAKAERGQVLAGLKSNPGSFPLAELNRLGLACEQGRLQTAQATFDLKMDGMMVNVRRAEDEEAALKIKRRKIVAPMDGLVVERMVNKGEWVQMGQPIVKIVRMDRVWVRASVSIKEHWPPDLKDRPVTVWLDPAGLPERVRPLVARTPAHGVVRLLKPASESDETFHVYAEVQNVKVGGESSGADDAYWLLRYGMRAQMTIHVDQPRQPRLTASTAN